jgi:hypothetical protein
MGMTAKFRKYCATAGVCAVALIGVTPLETQKSAPGALRCGWYQNPSPGNQYLTDRDAQWIVSMQGLYEAPGQDRLSAMDKYGWVKTNVEYGYSCACIRMDVNRKTQKVTRIYSGYAIPMSRCRNDKALPRP